MEIKCWVETEGGGESVALNLDARGLKIDLFIVVVLAFEKQYIKRSKYIFDTIQCYRFLIYYFFVIYFHGVARLLLLPVLYFLYNLSPLGILTLLWIYLNLIRQSNK